MRHFILSAATLIVFSISVTSMQAQDLKSILGNLAKEAIGEVTTTQNSIIGTWIYSAPAIQMDSDDALAGLGSRVASSSIVDKLSPIYEKMGLNESTFTFSADSTYSTQMSKLKTDGSYTFDAQTKTVKLETKVGVTVTAKVVTAGDSMTLLFNADKLMGALKAITGYVGNMNTKFASISSLLDKYDGLLVGFELTKQ